MSTYTESHRQYYLANKERILSLRLERERNWITTSKGVYSVQKRAAKKRGISWEFDFDSWWKVWQESGKWEERGVRADNYCMCRHNDAGGYSVENVRIDTVQNNGKESYYLNGIDTRGRYKSKYEQTGSKK